MPSNQDNRLLTRFEESLTQSALSASTIVNYLADLRAFLRWGELKVSPQFSLLQTNQEHVRLYRQYLAQELNRAASTVNRHLMALKKFFAFALKLGVITTNPTTGVSLVQDNGQVTSRPLTENEIERLLEAAQTGTRAGLVRGDVDGDAGVVNRPRIEERRVGRVAGVLALELRARAVLPGDEDGAHH